MEASLLTILVTGQRHFALLGNSFADVNLLHQATHLASKLCLTALAAVADHRCVIVCQSTTSPVVIAESFVAEFFDERGLAGFHFVVPSFVISVFGTDAKLSTPKSDLFSKCLKSG